MILIFLGAPGAGKGTQAKKLSNQLGIPQISTGDIFRDVIKRETELGKKVKSYVESGKLVPDELVVEMVADRIERDDCEEGFIFDGFPRTFSQAESLNELFDKKNYTIDGVVEFKVDKEEIIKRLVNRRVCSECGNIYNLLTDPPAQKGICDRCGGSLEQREDDKEEVIKERLEVYERQTAELINYYSEKKLLKSIDATGSPEEIFKRLKETLSL